MTVVEFTLATLHIRNSSSPLRHHNVTAPALQCLFILARCRIIEERQEQLQCDRPGLTTHTTQLPEPAPATPSAKPAKQEEVEVEVAQLNEKLFVRRKEALVEMEKGRFASGRRGGGG